MLALLYLALASAIGAELCATMLPSLTGAAEANERRPIASWVIAGPAAFLIGNLLMTWATYLVAWAFRASASSMAYANAIVMTVVALALIARVMRRHKLRQPLTINTDWRWMDIAVAVIGLAIGTAIMFHTARMEGSTLVLGRTAFGDLNIHLGMARSFSEGRNFPTGYIAYAGTDIRYHFMFYFLVGNLEFLGLRLDWALNLPSILSFASALLLLYALGAVIGRDRRVGAIAVLFFLLRSSPAFFFYVARLHGVAEFFGTRTFIGLTPNESFGIWTLNTYVVERHFGFALGLVFIAVLYLARGTIHQPTGVLANDGAAANEHAERAPRTPEPQNGGF
ncbi:MAG: hypothetical protein ABR582_13855 [Gemmatimonadaceae bacterium]